MKQKYQHLTKIALLITKYILVCGYNFILYLILHIKRTYFSKYQDQNSIKPSIQRPEIKFHKNHVLNEKYKNCQRLISSKLKFKK